MRPGPRSPLPEGYRKLAPLEIVKLDDIFDVGYKWIEAGVCCAGHTVIDCNSNDGGINGTDYQFARKIEQPIKEKEWLNPWD